VTLRYTFLPLISLSKKLQRPRKKQTGTNAKVCALSLLPFHRLRLLRMTVSHTIAAPHIIQASSSLPTITARRPSTRRPTTLAIRSRADSATSRSPWTTLRPLAHASRGWACHSKSALPMGRLRVLLSSWTRMDTGLRWCVSACFPSPCLPFGELTIHSAFLPVQLPSRPLF
jgi:hypothetical protein